jgi:hypothetical protein
MDLKNKKRTELEKVLCVFAICWGDLKNSAFLFLHPFAFAFRQFSSADDVVGKKRENERNGSPE